MNGTFAALPALLLLSFAAGAIDNGTVPNSTDPISQVVVGAYDNAKTPVAGCTATRIGQDTYITAAHCFKESPMDDIKVNGKFVQVLKPAQVNSAYNLNQTGPENDIAIFKTKPAGGVEPIARFAQPGESLKKGQTVFIAGMGMTTGSDRKNTTLHVAPFSMSSIHGKTLNVTGVKQKNGRPTGTCAGDSGGPGYTVDNGQVVLWGTETGGNKSYPGTPATRKFCTEDGVLLSLPTQQSWIQKSLAALNPKVPTAPVASTTQPTVNEALTTPGWGSTAEDWLQQTGATQ